MVWDWIASRFIEPQPPVRVPPVRPAPPVELTPPAERAAIDRKLQAAQARLEHLRVIVDLDRLRGRGDDGGD